VINSSSETLCFSFAGSFDPCSNLQTDGYAPSVNSYVASKSGFLESSHASMVSRNVLFGSLFTDTGHKVGVPGNRTKSREFFSRSVLNILSSNVSIIGGSSCKGDILGLESRDALGHAAFAFF